MPSMFSARVGRLALSPTDGLELAPCGEAAMSNPDTDPNPNPSPIPNPTSNPNPNPNPISNPNTNPDPNVKRILAPTLSHKARPPPTFYRIRVCAPRGESSWEPRWELTLALTLYRVPCTLYPVP